MILKLISCDEEREKSGVMIPVPQYPLYSASLTEFNLPAVGFVNANSSATVILLSFLFV